MESLIKTGAFDILAERKQLLQNLERLLEWSRENQKVKANGQKGLFEGMKLPNKIRLTVTKAATESEKLAWEKELLGLFVTSHPLKNFKKILDKNTMAISSINSIPFDQPIKVGGIISRIKKIITKNGKPMLFLSIEDLTNKIEVVVFPGVAERNPTVFQENKLVFLSGRLDYREGVPKIICEEIEEILET